MAAKRRYSSEDDSTKDRILQSALACISQTSIGGLSVRAIAAHAGVNVATVHYYFRTKDLIVTAALSQFFDHILLMFNSALNSDAGARDRLMTFLVAYTDIFYTHTGIFASLIETILDATLHRSPQPQSYEQVLIGVIAQAKPRLLGLVREVSGIGDETALAFKTLQLMTSLLHPILVSSLPGSLFGLDLTQAEQRRRYIASVVDSLGEGAGRGNAPPLRSC